MSSPLPTPSTSHLSFATIYEPSEDTFLILDTLSSSPEKAFFHSRFHSKEHGSRTKPAVTPLVVEVGTGSGIVIAFLTANAQTIFGQSVLTLGVDVNVDACRGTRQTVARASSVRAVTSDDEKHGHGHGHEASVSAGSYYLASVNSDLTTSLRAGSVDVLVFNPPYVPTEDLPSLPASDAPLQASGGATQLGQASLLPHEAQKLRAQAAQARHERESHLLALSYAGGHDGMEITNRLLEQIPDILSQRGVAYVLLCAQNRPDEVRQKIINWPGREGRWQWRCDVVGESGGKGGWERLVVVRIWRDHGGY